MAKSEKAQQADVAQRDDRMGRVTEDGRYVPAPPIARPGEPPVAEPPAGAPVEPLPGERGGPPLF